MNPTLHKPLSASLPDNEDANAPRHVADYSGALSQSQSDSISELQNSTFFKLMLYNKIITALTEEEITPENSVSKLSELRAYALLLKKNKNHSEPPKSKHTF